ncbi:hypothetical protein GEMRC1_012775 [Eukaryota sp. GEM-RC1]
MIHDEYKAEINQLKSDQSQSIDHLTASISNKYDDRLVSVIKQKEAASEELQELRDEVVRLKKALNQLENDSQDALNTAQTESRKEILALKIQVDQFKASAARSEMERDRLLHSMARINHNHSLDDYQSNDHVTLPTPPHPPSKPVPSPQRVCFRCGEV